MALFVFELQIGLVILLDAILGDPRWLPHPVRLIGFFCSVFESIFRKVVPSEFVAGLFTVVFVLLLSIGLSAAVLLKVDQISHLAACMVAVFLLYTSIAAKDLFVHSRAVYQVLCSSESLDPARHAVAQIVGRDTQALDKKAVVRACVETIAENMVDGVTAPLFYAVIVSLCASLFEGNPLFYAVCGAIGYKAVNTMDSMFGYKNKTYLWFGRIAALLDDLVNFIPARLTGLILIPTAYCLGLDWQGSFLILKRDRLSHASPNAAHSEAAVAGALGVQLGGNSFYFGKEIVKPTIGTANREIVGEDILVANKLMFLGSFFFILILLLFRFCVLQLFT